MRDNRTHYQLAELGILFMMLSILYFQVVISLIHAWNIKPQASHGYLIMPISLYLVWRKRERLAATPLEGNIFGLFFIFFGAGLYLIGGVARISSFSNISLILNIIGILLTICGKKITRELIFPILFLVFMFPIPDALYVSATAPLKLLVSRIAVELLQGMGIAVLREGNILILSNISLEVVEACSGLQSLISYLMLGFLLAYFLPRNTKIKKIFLVTLTLPTALLINVLRIVITGLLAYTYGKEAAEGFFHETSGLLLFLAGFLILLGVFKLMLDRSGKLQEGLISVDTPDEDSNSDKMKE